MPTHLKLSAFVNICCYQLLPCVSGELALLSVLVHLGVVFSALNLNYALAGSPGQLALLPGVRLQEGDLRHVWAQNHRHQQISPVLRMMIEQTTQIFDFSMYCTWKL